MTANQLIEKLCSGECDFAPAEIVDTARAAFLANLSEELKIKLPEGIWGDMAMKEKMAFLEGAIVGTQEEITDEMVKQAHMALILPSNRAIISRLLYGAGEVNRWGVPASYGVD